MAAWLPPRQVARITGVRSERDGQQVEGLLLGLGATPRQIMTRSPQFTYKRLLAAARMAHDQGARLMGLGAFTSVVGDAGVTVAKNSPIAVTSGNSLTVATTLEVAKQAARMLGRKNLAEGRGMVIGATGSIGRVCARMIALAVRDVVLVSIEPEKLDRLAELIRQETPGARVEVATHADGLVANCDLIVTATSGFGQRVLEISRCKPGAIICDVARPPDISAAEAELRPDLLVVESGEVVLPGNVEIGYDIGLPDGVAYACLAETALLAMAGRFESFTLGREIRTDKVKEIYRLFQQHGFRLAGLRSLGRHLTEKDLAEKRRLADALRADPELLRRTQEAAAARLAKLPPASKGVRTEN
jgi:predicted amino acid dehydrogenase